MPPSSHKLGGGSSITASSTHTNDHHDDLTIRRNNNATTTKSKLYHHHQFTTNGKKPITASSSSSLQHQRRSGISKKKTLRTSRKKGVSTKTQGVGQKTSSTLFEKFASDDVKSTFVDGTTTSSSSHGGVLDATLDTNNTATTADSTNSGSIVPNTMLSSSYGYNTGMNGMMYGGGSMMYGGGGMMSPMMFGGGPFSGLYQVMFGIQNVVFSLGQLLQMVGTNQQAMHQVLDSITSTIDHAIATFHEVRALEKMHDVTEEQQKRKRRLKAIRWAMVLGTNWLIYKLIRRIIRTCRGGARRRKQLQHFPTDGSVMNGGAYNPNGQYGYAGNYGGGFNGGSYGYPSGGYLQGNLYNNSLYGGGGYF